MKKKITLLLWMVLASVLLSNAQGKVNNPISQFYSGADDAYPSWVDDIKWSNRIDMSSYANGTTNFEKFENARDQLFAQGGGVLYYPAGTYNFTIPDQGPTGRGLMLKSGVVILGATPTGDKIAVDDGNIQLVTKFNFSYSTTSVVTDGNTVTAEFPGMWNIVGITPGSGEQLKDVKNVGIAWVELDGATIYFGMQLDWAANWLASPWLGAQSSGPWGSRVADGTHPMDAFHGYAANTTYHGAGSGRLVFGCELNNAAATNNRTTKYSGTIGSTLYESTPIFADRFSPRMGVNGSNVFVANNAITKPTRAFRYQTQVRYRKNATPYNFTPKVQNDYVLFDYGDQLGIDVNKSLLGTVISSQRRNFATSPYYENNIVVSDNYVYNHGHKGFEISGEWVVIKNNKNIRDFLQSGDNPYGSGSTWVLTMEGWDAAYETDDNMSRAFDLNGKSVWVDNNYFNNVGSNPGNDGEGILAQQHNDIDVFSWSFTNNSKGPNGDASYMGAWSCNIFGFLIFKNSIPGGMVGALAFTPPLYSLTIVNNGSATIKTDGVAHDLVTACPTGAPVAPINVQATYNTTKKCVVVTWADNTTSEIGYRIDRRITSSSTWKTIYYHPKISNTDPIDVSSYAYTNETDVNRAEFFDYLTANNTQVEYRIAAIDCNDNNAAATISNTVTLPSSNPNTPPSVSITSPANNATFAAGANITINANAADTDGTISKVEFYQGTTKLGEDTTSPYAYTWSAVPAGSYAIKAIATDNGSATTTSSIINITVNAGTSYAIPGKVQAETYSAMSGIQNQTTSDTGGGQNVGYIDTGDWMDYSVTVASAGTYQINYRVASQSGGGKLILRQGATDFHTVDIPSTSGWQTWTTVSANATLSAGTQTLRIYAQTGGWNINWFEGVTATGLRNPENPANTVNGLDYNYYEGNWSVLPDFNSLTSVKSGTVTTFDLTPRNRNDQFAFKYSGYVNVPTDGTYTFYTSSDDGSKFYIGTTEVVNNDGLHASQERTGTIGLKAGKHAITVSVFDQTGGESISVSYDGPGIAKTVVPASALFRSTANIARMVSTESGTTEVDEQETITVYPNPTSDVLHLVSPDIHKIELLNAQGVQVTVRQSNGDLHLGALPAGIYILKIKTLKMLHVKKIVKE